MAVSSQQDDLLHPFGTGHENPLDLTLGERHKGEKQNPACTNPSVGVWPSLAPSTQQSSIFATGESVTGCVNFPLEIVFNFILQGSMFLSYEVEVGEN